jgi:hypothetical protein
MGSEIRIFRDSGMCRLNYLAKQGFDLHIIYRHRAVTEI